MVNLERMIGKSFLLVVLAHLAFLQFVYADALEPQKTTPEDAGATAIVKEFKISEIVKEIESRHCLLTAKYTKELKLTAFDINKAKEFCKKTAKEKADALAMEFKKVKEQKNNFSKIVGYENSYSCIYNGSRNTGIPTYGDLGLSYSRCLWHDSGPRSCKVQGAVACLWGCTNRDPLLGWHKKYFSSRSALERNILPKGYEKIWNPAYGTGYRRTLPYGYSYEVALDLVRNGKERWHSEGPEPDPRFNWYAFNRGWWPREVYDWHQTFGC